MATGGPLPYLHLGSVEVANAARTVEYLRRGLGSTEFGHWEVSSGRICDVLYRLNGGTCAVPEVFVSPAADPAPWYDPLEPGSASFLGAVLLDVQGYDSTLYRNIAPRLNALGGGTFGGQHRNPRIWKFRAALVSAGDAGAEYGLRWLTAVLQAGACDTCLTKDLVVRLTCPPANCSDDTQGEWWSYDVALVDGPHEVTKYAPGNLDDTLAGCRDLTVVEFTVAAGNPFLYKRARTCFHATIAQTAVCSSICEFLFGSPGDAVCCAVTPPERGTLGAIFTLTPGGSSGSGFGGLLLEAYATCPGGSAGSGAAVPVLSIELSGVPAYSTVTVDSAKHTITVATYDPATGVTTLSDGQSLVVLPAGRSIEWLEVRDCDAISCLCVRTSSPCSSGSADVLLQTQVREG